MDRYKRYTPYNCSCGGGMRSPMANKTRDTEEYCLYDSQPISHAMAYVRKQEFRELYSSCEALNKGTLFSELNMPYCRTGGYRR